MRSLLSFTFLLLGANLAAAQGSADPTYWQDVRPILRRNCTVCHNERHVKKLDVSGGLALDTLESLKKGSAHKIVEPGKADKSLLYQLIITKDESKRMPLDGLPLESADIAVIKLWIERGLKEGKAETEPEPLKTTIKSTTRKLDVVLATTAVPPQGLFSKAKATPLQLRLKVGPLAPVTAVAFSPEGKYLASGSYGQVTVWDRATGQPAQILTNVLGAVNDLQFSPDGKILAVAGGQPSAKGDLRLFQTGDWKLLHTMRGHDDVVFSIDFRKDGQHIASASFDHTVRVWDVAGGNALAEYGGHSDFVYAVAYSPDGKYLVSCSKDRTVKLMDAVTGKSVFTFSGMNDDVLALAYSPDGKRIVSSGFEARIYWWDPSTGESNRVLAGHGVAVNELAFSKDGKRLVSAGGDRTAKIYDAEPGTVLRTLAVGSQVYAVAISPDGKQVATGSFDGLVRLWDEAKGGQLATLLSLPAADDKAEWLTLTPQGFLASSAGIAEQGRWLMGNEQIAADQVWPALRNPQNIAKALRGDSVEQPKFGK